MKNHSPWLAVLALILGLTGGLGAYETAADALKAGRQKLQAKDYAGALKDADDAIALAGANAPPRNDAILFKAQAAEAAKDPAKAKEEYAKVAADAAATMPQRITAINRTAALLLEEGKMEEVKAEYAKVAALPGVGLGDKLNAALALGKAYERQKDPTKATEAYAGIVAEPAASKWHKTQATKAIAGILMGKGQYDEARAAYTKLLDLPDLGPKDQVEIVGDVARSYERQGNYANARVEYGKAAALEGLDAKSKAGVLVAVARTFHRERDLAGMKQAMAAVTAAAQTPDYALLRDYAALAGQQGNTLEEDASWAQITTLPGINNAQYAEAAFKRIELLAAAKKPADAGKLAAGFAADAKFTDEQRFMAALLAAGFALTKSGTLDAKAIPPTTFDADKQAKLYTDAAKVFMRTRYYEAARLLNDRATGLFRPPPAYVHDCKFMDQAPFGVSGWEHSEIVKDPARREARFEEYNKKAAALLVNDVNAVREVGSGTSKTSGTAFYMAADVRGWHVYVHCQDDQVESVLAGLATGTSLEMYFAPGPSECYYQWMLTVPSAKTSFYPWMSPYRHYRKLDDYLKVEVAPVADGFGVYLCFPWDLVYDKLPQEGDQWTFGLVDWSRNGSFIWGSGQVHELSRFGKVRFVGAAKYLPAIRRTLVLKAFAAYKKAAAAATTVWRDEVKGDQAFYEQVLQPQLAQFNELGKLVKPDMPQADVDRLFAVAVPDWMEFGYKVAELRSAWLEARLFAEDR